MDVIVGVVHRGGCASGRTIWRGRGPISSLPLLSKQQMSHVTGCVRQGCADTGVICRGGEQGWCDTRYPWDICHNNSTLLIISAALFLAIFICNPVTLPSTAQNSPAMPGYCVTSVGVTISFVILTYDTDMMACQGGGRCRVLLIGG